MLRAWERGDRPLGQRVPVLAPLRCCAEAVGDMYESVFLRNIAPVGGCSAEDDLVVSVFFWGVAPFGACSAGCALASDVPLVLTGMADCSDAALSGSLGSFHAFDSDFGGVAMAQVCGSEVRFWWRCAARLSVAKSGAFALVDLPGDDSGLDLTGEASLRNVWCTRRVAACVGCAKCGRGCEE